MRHETFPADARPLRSFAARASIALYCEVRQGVTPWKVARISDLSETGFKLAWLPDYDQDKPLRVRIPGIEMLTARICWVKGKRIGCEFAAPLHVAVFEHVVRVAQAASR